MEPKVAYFEKQMMRENPVVEREVAELVKAGKKDEAAEVLNSYTQKWASTTSKAWEDLKAELWTIFIRSM